MAKPNQRSLPSLRLWLQSTTLLAVIAGYALLLGVNRYLNHAQRLEITASWWRPCDRLPQPWSRPSRRMLPLAWSLSWCLPVQNRLPCSFNRGTHLAGKSHSAAEGWRC